MAKKDNKDELEDNDNNKDKNEDINENDDSFGLPHVEYEPIDYDEPSYGETPADEPENVETSANDDGAYGQSEEGYQEEQAYVPGSYVPPSDNSVVPKVIALVLILLLVGAGVWYFGFHKPEQEALERARVEEQRQLELQEKREAQARAEQERQALEQAQAEEAEAKLGAEAESTTGTIETISSRTGRYYVVIASGIDEDLAMDHAKKLSNNGISATIIEPFGNSKFHRIAIENRDTWAAAQSEANKLKSEYGDEVWVIKY